MNVWPATVSVPVRGLGSVLAATEKLTAPSPLPLLPELMVIQLASLIACQLHAGLVVTFTLPIALSAEND